MNTPPFCEWVPSPTGPGPEEHGHEAPSFALAYGEEQGEQGAVADVPDEDDVDAALLGGGVSEPYDPSDVVDDDDTDAVTRIRSSPASPRLCAATRPRYCMLLRTVQSGAFKILIEACKELVSDAGIEFDEAGMRILSADALHIVLVHLRLDACKFEEYYCPTRLRVCVNLLNLHKLIKTLHVSDVLSLFIESHDMNHLGISIENDDKKMRTKYSLNLLDLDEDERIHAPAVDFNGVTTLPSADFQKICRDMSNLAHYMEVRLYQHQLVLSCKGDWSSQETIVHDAGPGSDEIVQGVFSLKHLVQFTKCTNLSSRVDLYLKNNYPLIVKYAVSSLGEVSLCLAPHSPAVDM